MSTKTTLASNGATSESVLGVGVKIKKEPQSDEIKEFAEHTMNELLGWYGFDGVDRMDLSTKTPRLLSSGSSNGCSMTQHANEKRRSRSRTANLLDLEKNYKNHKNTNNYNNNDQNSCDKNSSPVVAGMATGLGGNESTTSDHDTRSSRDDDSKSPLSNVQNRFEEKIDLSICCWCRRPVPENAPEFLTTSDGPRYCSETCFAQSRRASFKKAKTCDWCKHVRHAVSYVDFQDGASQLQFCSDKCLNQYKMQIFCKETQAHLDMNPHLREQGMEAGTNGANLITPELWLRNCRSRSVSPASTISVSPSPAELTIVPPVLPALSPARAAHSLANQSGAFTANKTAHKPMISVAPVSKLMSKNPPHPLSSRPSLKNNRRKRPMRSCVSNNANLTNPLPLKTNQQVTHGAGGKPHSMHYKNSNNSGLNQFAGSSVQDLHMTMPPLSPMMEHQHTNSRATSIPPAYFATPTHHAAQQSPNTAPHSTGFSPTQRPHFLPNPRFFGFPGVFQPPMPTPLMQMNQFAQPDLGCMNALIGAPPPVTVMVPYPVILPLPIPIPIPLPIMDFYKAHRLLDKKEDKSKTEQPVLDTMKQEDSQTPSRSDQGNHTEENSRVSNKEEQPIDYTKARETTVSQTVDVIAVEEEVPQNTENMCLNGAAAARDATPTLDVAVDTDTFTHCIVASEVNDNEEVTDAHEDNENDDTKQKLPKFKITRLQTKRTLLQAREAAESSRPLRKRKRLIDCDFQTVLLKGDETLNENDDLRA